MEGRIGMKRDKVERSDKSQRCGLMGIDRHT